MQTFHTRIKSDGQRIKRLAAALQDHMTLYGYRLVETCIIENADLFLTKAGDQVAEKLFRFERHGRNLALRPEFTAAAAHRYITERDTGDTVRWQFSGPVFEDNPDSTTDSYQRHSVGAELLNAPGSSAEAEMISMATQGLISQGIDNWALVIGHVGLTRHLLSRYQLDTRTQRFILQRRHLLKQSNGKKRLLEQFNAYAPRTDSGPNGTGGGDPSATSDTQKMLDAMLGASRRGTMGGRTQYDIARRMLNKRQQAAQRSQVEAAIDFLEKWTAITTGPQRMAEMIRPHLHDDHAHALFDEWHQTIELLQAYQIPPERIIIQPDLARTWDYYTGVVFELRTDQDIQLAGGGRYDELTKLIGGTQPVPAVGFAYYVDCVLQVMPETQTSSTAAVHLIAEDAADHDAARWATALRQRGVPVVLDAGTNEDAVVTLVASGGGLIRLGDRVYDLEELDKLVKVLDGR